jgi:putative alpha-1,2-mannosidase
VLEIKAPDNSLSNLYVAKVSWNGEALPSLEIGYDELMQGGVLLFDMAPGPDQAVGQA